MKKNTKIAIVLGIGALVAAISYYFIIWKPKHSIPENELDSANESTSNSGNTSNSTIFTKPTESVIGKNIYASFNDVKVLDMSGNTMRIKAKNEYVGTIAGEKTLSGKAFYTVAGGAWVVAKNLVYIK